MTGEQLKCILYAAGIPQAELAKKGVSGDAGTPKLLKHTIMVCGAKVKKILDIAIMLLII